MNPLDNHLVNASLPQADGSSDSSASAEAPIGQVSVGADGRPQILAANGQAVHAGSTVSAADSVGAISTANAAAGQSVSGSVLASTGPDLPDVEGDKAGPQATQAAVVSQMGGGSGDAFAGDSGSISFAMMYGILQKAITSAQQMSGTLQRVAGKNAVSADLAAVADTYAKIEADKKAATTNLVSSIIGVSGAAGLSFYGTHLQAKGTSSAGAMMNAIAQPFSQFVDSGARTWNINQGYELESREADVRIKQDEVNKQLAQNVRESSKNNYDQTTEFIRNLNQFLLTCIQNWKGAKDNIANR